MSKITFPSPLLPNMRYTDYFPPHLVDKVEALLKEFAGKIEKDKPTNLEQLQGEFRWFNHKMSEIEFEFDEAGSDIETAAREDISDALQAIADFCKPEEETTVDDLTNGRYW
jgi:hypothetical protein